MIISDIITLILITCIFFSNIIQCIERIETIEISFTFSIIFRIIEKNGYNVMFMNWNLTLVLFLFFVCHTNPLLFNILNLHFWIIFFLFFPEVLKCCTLSLPTLLLFLLFILSSLPLFSTSLLSSLSEELSSTSLLSHSLLHHSSHHFLLHHFCLHSLKKFLHGISFYLSLPFARTFYILLYLQA